MRVANAFALGAAARLVAGYPCKLDMRTCLLTVFGLEYHKRVQLRCLRHSWWHQLHQTLPSREGIEISDSTYATRLPMF